MRDISSDSANTAQYGGDFYSFVVLLASRANLFRAKAKSTRRNLQKLSGAVGAFVVHPKIYKLPIFYQKSPLRLVRQGR